MQRHPAHELYDGGCDVLAAAQTLTTAARRQGYGDAIPATLGCLGAALDELAATSDVLAAEMRGSPAAMQTLDRLTDALTAARDACDTARSKAAARAWSQSVTR